jgi:hypothetical protein
MGLLSSDRRTPASVRLISAEETERVSQTGAVGSVQEAEVTLPSAVLERLWSPEYLERLARAYWRHLTRATLGLVKIAYEPGSRAAVLVSRRLPLLRFRAPSYETSADEGCVTWQIERGLLVASEGRDNGFLRIRVRRRRDPRPVEEATVEVRLEVRNFYPWLRGSGRFARFGAWLYGQTQLRIHVLVCNAFLRSLARLDLPRSQVGALVAQAPPTDGGPV